jgi:proline iminopeptidase
MSNVSRIITASGYIPVTGGRVWYEVSGGGTGRPLLLLHGGPGFTHWSFEPLLALDSDRPVIVYDQLGSGESDRPDDPDLWTVARFVEELELVRSALDLSSVDILGHSWGTMLLASYLATQPAGVNSAIFSSPCLKAELWSVDQRRHIAQLPDEFREPLQSRERGEEVDDTVYERAVDAFYRRHLCRLDPWPEPVQRDFEAANLTVYETMWGPTEFEASGTLRDFDATPILRDLELPTLFTCGRYDEATPESTGYFAGCVRGSSLHVFENSGHMTYVEEPDEYLSVVRAFLDER